MADPVYLPILRSSDEDLHGALSRALPAGSGLSVSFATRSPTGLAFLSGEDASRRRLSVEGAEHLAKRALAARDGRPGWTVVRSAVGRWLERSGDAHTSADLLDLELLADAQRLLDSDELAAIVPTRSFLAVAPPHLADLLAVIAQRLHRAAADAGRDPLSRQVLHVQNGELLGVVDTAATEPAAPVAAVDDLPPPTQVDGSARFSLNVATVEEAETQTMRLLDHWLPLLCEQDWFKGLVIVSCNGYLLAPTDANREAMHELQSKLADLPGWKQRSARNGKAVTVRLRVDS